MYKNINQLRKIFISLVLMIFSILMTGCIQRESYHTFEQSKYMQTEGHISDEGRDIRSGLFIFPESIEKLQNVEYEYYCEKGVLDNIYMIFLKGSYPDRETYKAELKRLESIECVIETSDGSVKNKIEYTESLFCYPAYVTIYHTNMSFEYALLDEEDNSVIYVFLKLCEGSSFLPDRYLPIEFKGKTMLEYDTSWKNQNIYYASDGDGVHKYYLD